MAEEDRNTGYTRRRSDGEAAQLVVDNWATESVLQDEMEMGDQTKIPKILIPTPEQEPILLSQSQSVQEQFTIKLGQNSDSKSPDKMGIDTFDTQSGPPRQPPSIAIEIASPNFEKEPVSLPSISNYPNISNPNMPIISISSRIPTRRYEFQPPESKSNSGFLGADLLSPNNMAPPKLNVVKKSRIMVNPGKSMVEWMQIQQHLSTKGPTKLRKIGMDELATHNKLRDVWMALNDKVYDVSDYTRYHPGGVEEIMKGAGQDATQLFNQIHRWVNFESILKANLLGYLVRHSTLALINNLSLNMKIQTPKEVFGAKSPSTKFSEDDDSLYFEVELTDDDTDLKQECWTVGVLNRERLVLKLVLKPPDLWMAHLQLLKALEDDCVNLKFRKDFRQLRVTLKKPQKERWKALGAPLEENNKLIDSRGAVEDMYPAQLVKKQELTHNVSLFTFEVAKSAVIGVPIGFHLRIRINDEICRKYTPIPVNTSQVLNQTDPSSSSTCPFQLLQFMIKIYPSGQLTPKLHSLPLNSPTHVEIGSPGGSFDPIFLHQTNTLCLLAAGSGITPFIRIIQYLQMRRMSVLVNKVMLLFFNETVEDIVWHEEWRLLAEKEEWFYYYPVISKSDSNHSKSDWRGLQGRISPQLLEQCVRDSCFKEKTDISRDKNDDNVCKAIICGSYGFNDTCKQTLRQQTVLRIRDPTDIFIFTG